MAEAVDVGRGRVGGSGVGHNVSNGVLAAAVGNCATAAVVGLLRPFLPITLLAKIENAPLCSPGTARMMGCAGQLGSTSDQVWALVKIFSS